MRHLGDLLAVFGTRRSEVQILSPRLFEDGVFRSHG